MNKLTLFSRMILFLTSYIPLGIIFIIINYKGAPYPFFRHPYMSVCLIIFMIILVFSLLMFLRHFKRKLSPIETMKIINVQNMDGEILSYIFTYILPFLGFPENKQLPISLFLLIIIGVLYVKSDMIGINPILSFLGYHILKVEWTKDTWTKSKEIILISKKDYFQLKCMDYASAIQIQKDLHLLKENNND